VRAFATGETDKKWLERGNLGPVSRMLFDAGPEVELTDQELAHVLELYDEEILYFDRQFAELVRRLDTDGTLDRTLLIFVSDHGEEFLEHDHVFHCRDLAYDTVLRTPLVFWVPGLNGPKVTENLVQNLDVVPTVLDYLGIDPSALELDGKSLRPVIEEDRPVHRYVFGSQRFSRWATDGRFKVIHDIKTGRKELFDLIADPGERELIHEERSERAQEMSEALTRWIEQTEGDAPLATRVEGAAEVHGRLKALGYLQ
jgi:arylsulfatase A-like enzyme